MASIKPTPNGTFRGVVWLPGRQRKQMIGSLKEVEAWAATLELQKSRGTRIKPGATRTLTLAKFYEQTWLPVRRGASGTLDKQDSYWRNHIEPMWGRSPIGKITTHGLDGWVTAMVNIGDLSPATIRGIVYYLSRVMRAAVKTGVIDHNPVADMDDLPKPEPVEHRIVDVDEIRHVVKVLDDWHEQPAKKHGKRPEPDPRRTYGTLYLLAWQTGLRWAELAGVPVRAVDLERRILHVVKVRNRDGKEHARTKNGTHRIVPLTDETAERLRLLIAGRTANQHVFANPRSGEPLDYHRTYGRVWRPAIEAAGLDPAKLRPRQHDLRHSAGTNMLEGGVRIDHVRDILGHSDTRMTEQYAHRISDGFESVREVFDRD